ncbi:PaaX family transcriptional regulator C-terminal domain-containing protein [Gemmobacter serpentinus]|uniref:PaaX family transcriptional regulator C-terminal domain-containing protein n=1 Tax=Gemmobacter serpentinus TaxID=2652247 RepID=UPI00124CA202|nr:PaaX family transcriptional regulator C-terminal domain-containing protein [Gemmobacter serpentinus]
MIEPLLKDLPLKAASFIVTIYGDLVVPRGEILWMGSLIEVCGRVGIGEAPVRTAVSRLVQAGRLEGERVGRRSFYRLAPAARAEFGAAARLLYAPDAFEDGGWLVVHAPGLTDDIARQHHLARMGGDVWIAPDHGQDLGSLGTVLRAGAVVGADRLTGFWELSRIRDGYAGMLSRFEILDGALAAGATIPAADAMIARLLLVHVYRGVMLRDPRLPVDALPVDWPGIPARRMFRDLYRALSPAADLAVGQSLQGSHGRLEAITASSEARLAFFR